VKLAELGVPPEVLAAEGAVSEAVARAMAEGVRRKLNADIALSTTGVAGPAGGSEAKPVGTVWVGYADAQGSFARKHTFERDRMRNIERTVATALNVARVAVAGSAKTP
jgi:nicotinamide-nucleotide amidase